MKSSSFFLHPPETGRLLGVRLNSRGDHDLVVCVLWRWEKQAPDRLT